MKYTKKAVTKRFRLQKTKRGREIRKATVERRDTRKRKIRPIKKGKQMRAMRKR